MIRKTFLFLVSLTLASGWCFSQAFIKTTDLFQRHGAGDLNIIQDQAIDSLISHYIIANKKIRTFEGNQGMQGFRIQIFLSPARNARVEADKVRMDFIDKFPEDKYPDLKLYPQTQEPAWYMLRVGDYRNKIECYKDLILIQKEFPNSYHVPTVINFPDQKK